jgi:hypothetical protein
VSDPKQEAKQGGRYPQIGKLRAIRMADAGVQIGAKIVKDISTEARDGGAGLSQVVATSLDLTPWGVLVTPEKGPRVLVFSSQIAFATEEEPAKDDAAKKPAV